MEECKGETMGKKRERDDSGFDSESPESKRFRHNSVPNSPECDLVDSDSKSCNPDRVDSECSEPNSPETKKITEEDILGILDDPDVATDRDPEIEDLDLVIKSFEEEILNPAPVKDSGELSYLLEASDYELGLPPVFSQAEDKPEDKFFDLVMNPIVSDELGESLRFLDDLTTSYDPFGFGTGEYIGGNGDFVTVDGLFDHSEGPEFSWQPESLPAV